MSPTGAAAFCLADKKGNIKLIGRLQVPGEDETMDAYRSKVAGLCGIIWILGHIEQFTGMQTKGVILGCNNEEAGYQCIASDEPIKTSMNHFNMLYASWKLSTRIKQKLVYNHVEGHQMEIYGKENLDAWARLNYEMDMHMKL